jgi:cobyrinic acid a,c-diamide synthase
LNEIATRALLIGAPASGQGKTTVTAALARRARERGWRVRVFKTGPDFIDPMILEYASGAPVYALDLWMGGEAHCRELLFAAAGSADLILVEGVMGLFDGSPSSADLAQLFDLPIVAVIDANAMAQTFGAVAMGLRQYRPQLKFQGVLANRVAGPAHAHMLATSLPADLAWMGSMSQDAALAIPDRHLGLVQAHEIADLEWRLLHAASLLTESDQQLDNITPTVFRCDSIARTTPNRLDGVRIAIARDQAFSFIYPANLQLLRHLGASLCFFSPLTDSALPLADAVYLPGGYPELHATQLAANTSLHRALRAHAEGGKPLVAECGGMMFLLQSLVDLQSREHRMVGVLAGCSEMQPKLQSLSLQAVRFADGELRGHSYHHSRLRLAAVPGLRATTQYGAQGEGVFQHARVTASYIHFYWPSNPAAVVSLFMPDAPAAVASNA